MATRFNAKRAAAQGPLPGPGHAGARRDPDAQPVGAAADLDARPLAAGPRPGRRVPADRPRARDAPAGGRAERRRRSARASSLDGASRASSSLMRIRVRPALEVDAGRRCGSPTSRSTHLPSTHVRPGDRRERLRPPGPRRRGVPDAGACRRPTRRPAQAVLWFGRGARRAAGVRAPRARRPAGRGEASRGGVAARRRRRAPDCGVTAARPHRPTTCGRSPSRSTSRASTWLPCRSRPERPFASSLPTRTRSTTSSSSAMPRCRRSTRRAPRPTTARVPARSRCRRGQTVETTFTFPDELAPGWEFACHLPGHYAYGMHGPISIG